MDLTNGNKKPWYTDRITEYEQHDHKVKRWITIKKNNIQQLAIAELFSFGRCLIIDDDIQSCESDEYIYHEALVHPAMISHGSPSNVLILGGGEGATLREALKYKTVSKATMVDIDDTVIKICRKYMPGMSNGAFEDPRTKLVIQDAKQFVSDTRERFDVIISDLSSPVKGGPAYQLYTKEFYRTLKTKLAHRGIFSAQVDSCSPISIKVPVSIYKTLRMVFSEVQLYTCYIPSFDSLWGFILATDDVKNLKINRKEIDRRLSTMVSDNTLFYDGQTHEGMFALPRDIRNRLSKRSRAISIKSPLFIYK